MPVRQTLSATVVIALTLVAAFALPAQAATPHHRATGGPDGTSATTFGEASQLAFNQDQGRLAVLDAGAPAIHSFTTPGLSPAGGAFPIAVSGGGLLPDIAIDNTASPSPTAGNIYYVSQSTNQIEGFNAAGGALGGNYPISPPNPTNLCGVAVDSSGKVYVSDQSAHMVRVYDALGNPIDTIDTSAQANGQACDLAFDSNDNLFLSFAGVGFQDESVYRYDAPTYTTATRIDPTAASAIAVDRTTDHLYVAHRSHEFFPGYVSVYAADGTFLYNFAAGGDVAGIDPAGVAIDEDSGIVYVSDAGNDKVHAFGSLAAETRFPSDISESTESATINGAVASDATLTDCHFEFVTAQAYETSGFGDLSSGGTVSCEQAPGSLAANGVPHSVSAEVPYDGPAYYYRLTAENTSESTTATGYRTLGYGVASLDGEVLDEGGQAATQAGSHPATASLKFSSSSTVDSAGLEWPSEDLQNATVELPPGLIGNPQNVAECTQVQLAEGFFTSCPPASRVGTVTLVFTGPLGNYTLPWGIYNMQRPKGVPALFGFSVISTPVQVYGKPRVGRDYGIDVISTNNPDTLPIGEVQFLFEGVVDDKPFLTLPTSCTGPTETGLTATSWKGSISERSSFLSHAAGEPGNLVGTDGCNALEFDPTLEARPTTNVADSASGLDVDLHIPQNEDPEGTAEAHLKDTTVTLPEGLVINPSGANGLDGCSLSEFGYTDTGEDGTIHTTPDAASCPDASKQGTVEVESPLLDHPLQGAVYLADPYANPFQSLLGLYITVNDVQSGIVIKLAGEVEADPNTGQLTATFKQNPQLPFEDFRLHFFGGAGGALRTPATCGTYTTTSSMTPWSAPDSGPPASPSDLWAIETAPGGGTCPTSQGALPNSPDLDAGSVSPVAGTATPTVVNLRRNDGTQEFSAINLTLPPGLTGKLVGIGQCSDAALAAAASKSGNEEKSSPSCPSSSRIGVVDVAAGAGPAPYNTQGTAYLTGPYKGAPLGMAIITPATAGPFDLGTVVVRVALYVDRNSARINAVSDPLPRILQGIPLDIRSAKVTLDRPDFTRNGTNCDPSSFEGNLVSTLNQSASLTERFQLGECSALAFKPKLAIRLFGGTKRGGHPALRATLQMPAGGANIGKAVVALPKSEFLDQGHIGTVCTRVQFAARECPAASIYGSVTATSPLVDYALYGNAYLRSSDNKLPDLVLALHGPPSYPIEVDAVGRIDSIKGGIRTTFEGVPDIPVSSLVLNMAGGKKGLLENSTNICKGKPKATAEFDGQNGKASDFKVLLKNGKCKSGKAKKRKAAQRNAR